MNSIPPFSDPQHRADDDHLKTLSILHFVLGGLNLFGGAWAIVQSTFFGPFMEKMFADFEKNAAARGQNGPFVPDMSAMMHGMMKFFTVLAIVWAVVGVLNIFSGYFLRHKRHRTFSLIVAALNCLHIPLGTVLGVFTFIVLGRGSVREAYQNKTSD
ncbi:MAG TPA: hypothetical protein VGY55_16345 [Pirellulales bacterium]|jgi:hypothetical protein|nr:hypothetical protein [Pirellulales bacterium]